MKKTFLLLVLALALCLPCFASCDISGYIPPQIQGGVEDKDNTDEAVDSDSFEATIAETVLKDTEASETVAVTDEQGEESEESETKGSAEAECQHPYANVVAYPAKAPTCTDIGWDAYIVCTRCGMTTYVEKEAIGHVAENEATCTEAQHCAVCHVELAPAKGHNPGEEATCDKPQTCLTCGAVLNSVMHDIVDGVCTVCGRKFEGSGLEFASYGDGTCYVKGIGSCTDTVVVIPAVSPDGDTVVGIGKNAFMGCKSIESVFIPSSITNIGGSAFSGCASLKEVHITDLAAWCNVSMSRYSDNPVYYSNNLYLNGELLTDLVIPEGVKSIGTYAFDMCKSIERVTIPASVESIGASTFYGCINIESITVDEGNQWFCVKNNCLIDITNKKLLRAYGESVIPTDGSVTSIGYGAFSLDENIQSLVIPECITSIDNYAFDRCTNLKTFYYCGTEASFSNIILGLGISLSFSNATIIYNYIPE